MKTKAQKEVLGEGRMIAAAYLSLQERFEKDLMMYGKVTDEAKDMLRLVDQRAERVLR